MPNPRYESKLQPGLFFWAERVDEGKPNSTWMVVQQANGFPGTEAHDDWFAKFEDADEIAKALANDEQF